MIEWFNPYSLSVGQNIDENISESGSEGVYSITSDNRPLNNRVHGNNRG